MCHRFSKLTRVVPLRDVTALDVLSTFIDVWIASYGIPDSTLSENRPQFASVLYQGVLQMLGIGTNYTTPYHPQTNGQVERFNTTLVLQLRHYVREHVVTWAKYVNLLVTAYISQVHDIVDPPILSSSTRNGSWRYGSCGAGHLLVKRSRKQLLSTNLRRPIGSPSATSVQNRDPSFY